MVKIKLSGILGEKRISQKDLSIKTGIRAATINELYNELVDRVNLEHLSKICKLLDCEISDILEYVPDQEKQKKKKR